MKTCTKCNRLLPIELFSKRRGRSRIDGHWMYGYYAQCKSCIAERKRIWRESHPGYFKEYHKKHRVLKPIIIKVCPNCGNEFKTNKINQVRCNKSCLPMTPVRIMKRYLKQHPEIDRNVFFKDRYKKRSREYHQNWKQKHKGRGVLKS